MIPLGIIGKLKNSTAINVALASNGGTISSNIAPSFGSLSNLLLGNRQVTEASGNWAYWDFTGATEDLVVEIYFPNSNIDKIVCAWGLDGTVVGSNTIDTAGLYFPKNSGELISLESSAGGGYSAVPFTTPTSRLQEFVFTERISQGAIRMTISKDITFQTLYMCGIEVWGN